MTLQDMSCLEFPSSPLSVECALYIERPPIEPLAYTELTKPGSVIRIKGSRKMGKSSLLNRILAHGEELGYAIARLNFQQADDHTLADIHKFLRWFCTNVSLQLGLPSELDEFWDQDIGSKLSATVYFQGYLLEQLQTPLVLALNDIHSIFEYPHIAKEFLPLLRSWHEDGKQSPLWQKLRLVVVHSTEIYIPLNLNQSPFNVGLPLTLSPFTLEQVQDLTLRHGLTWAQGNNGLLQLQPLHDLIGGHPYLVHLALYYLCTQTLSLDTLIRESPTMSGIYRDHLRNQLALLQHSPDLCNALKRVLDSSQPIPLEALKAYQLEGMGLVNLQGNEVEISCQLYQHYFQEQLLALTPTPQWRLSPSDSPQTVQLDPLTQVPNRHLFEDTLEAQWQRCQQTQTALALLCVDIDYFRVFNDEYGHLVGDDCLREIANLIVDCAKMMSGWVARYESDQFMIILSDTTTADAVQLGETIRDHIKLMGLAHDESSIGGLPDSVLTVSVGVVCVIPKAEVKPSDLTRYAGEALYLAKRRGRNTLVVSPFG